jgi:hypothetical protein
MSDSFADLWNTSAPLPAKPKPQNLTLAARLAEERKQHRDRVTTTSTTTTVGLQSHKAPDVSSHSTWAGLDSLESGLKVKVDDDDDWGLRDFGQNHSKSSSALHLLDNDNDHDNLIGGGGAGNHEVEDEEDILGILSKPVEVVIAKKVFLFLFQQITVSFNMGYGLKKKISFFFRTRIQDCLQPPHILHLHHQLDKVQDPPPLPLTS